MRGIGARVKRPEAATALPVLVAREESDEARGHRLEVAIAEIAAPHLDAVARLESGLARSAETHELAPPAVARPRIVSGGALELAQVGVRHGSSSSSMASHVAASTHHLSEP